MFVLVTPMRTRGVPLTPKERDAYPPVHGYVMVTAQLSTELGRASNIAWILSSMPGGYEPLPKLLDVTLSRMSQTGFVLAGIEYIDGCAYAQSWWCRQ